VTSVAITPIVMAPTAANPTVTVRVPRSAERPQCQC
jgi:hypothetical protein